MYDKPTIEVKNGQQIVCENEIHRKELFFKYKNFGQRCPDSQTDRYWRNMLFFALYTIYAPLCRHFIARYMALACSETFHPV